MIKGTVSVSGNLAGESRLLRQGDAVSVDMEGTIQAIDAEEKMFQRMLPASVKVVAVDDFEIVDSRDDMILPGEIPGWRRIGSEGRVGRFNPEGRGRFYDVPEMIDTGEEGGVCQGMKGPCLGYFSGVRDGGLERELDTILPGSVYTVTLNLGVRKDGPTNYAGYTISLMSGDTVLQAIRSREPPCEENAFRTVTMSWNSENRPEGVQEGDPLSIFNIHKCHRWPTHRAL